MMRKLIGLVPWMVLTGAAYGQIRQADVLYTHFDSVPTRGFRVGDEVFVALDDVSRWDWSVTTRAELAFVKAEGVEFMVPTRAINGRLTLPLIAAIRKAGGLTSWDRQTDTLKVYSEMTTIRVQNGTIKFYSPFATEPRFGFSDNPKRLIIDLPGCSVSDKTQQFLDQNAAITQLKPDMVRLVVEMDEVPDLSKLKRGATHSFELELPRAKPKEEEDPPVVDPPVKQEDPPVQEQDPTQVAAPGILNVSLVKETERGLSLTIGLPATPQPAAQARRPQPEVLEVTLPGLAVVLPDDFKLESPTIKSITRDYNGSGTVVRFEFSRPMAAEMVTEGRTVRLNLIKPSVSGSLAGKVIVVDPGHGGHDSGAKAGGVFEKNLNLTMGKLIAQELTDQGATVIMTRKSDVFIPLTTRAKIANDSDADLFVSSHINSTGGSGTQAGTITFHHLGREQGKLLAECIHREIVKVSGLPNIGVWSDGKIYQSGFSVLRQTNMPGVLLELGFINSSDRYRLVQSDFQQKVAKAVVKGIKVFLGDGQ